MTGRIKKRLMVAGVAALVIVPLEVTGMLPKAAARCSTAVYVAVKYPDRGLSFQMVEYSPQFGYYHVIYKDKQGQQCSFSMTPNFFPAYITFDSLDPPC